MNEPRPAIAQRRPTTVKEVLNRINLGSSVAEFDKLLNSYFVQTQTFTDFVSGEYDIVAGDKGTGKTALFQAVTLKKTETNSLRGIDIVPAFNTTGSPIFQRLTQLSTMSEGQYITVWKSYFLSLIGNWLIAATDGGHTESIAKLVELLRRAGFISTEEPGTVFSKILNGLKRWVTPKKVGVEFSFNETGFPVIKPEAQFESTPDAKDAEIVEHEYALGLLNNCLAEANVTVWVMVDRLDEAFQGYPETEIPALRALLRTYLDFSAFPQIKLKLFVRNDLFRKVIGKQFVNLTHINAQKLTIRWEDADLLNLLVKRLRGDESLINDLGLNNPSDGEIFAKFFPAKVDPGTRKPTTLNWMLARIKDGNGTAPPRNLIDLATFAVRRQTTKEGRAMRPLESASDVIEPDSIKGALHELSETRVQDTLLAEAAELAPLVNKFAKGKALHNKQSLAILFGIAEDDVANAVKPLIEIGFLGIKGENYIVPMLYRRGLEITQGKAFTAESGESSDDDDEDDD